MKRFIAKSRRFLASEDGPSPTEYTVVFALLAFLGYVVYRLLSNGLF